MPYRNQVLIGDVFEKLKDIPDGVIQCCVTSPPYYGLRDYGARIWIGGDPSCTHDQEIEHGPHHPGQVEQTKWKSAEAAGKGQTATTNSCSKCGAWFGQLGLEPTPEMYVKHLVEVFQEVHRVLRPDGTLWLNLGDSFAQAKGHGHWTSKGDKGDESGQKKRLFWKDKGAEDIGLKPKDLMGIPWRVAFALQEDGWWLRSDIIWEKPNCMPESVRDRPTRSHEYIFLLTKEADYFYDQDSIREKHSEESQARINRTHHTPGHKWENGPGDQTISNDLSHALHPAGRNKRSVWTINSQPFSGAHFAVFPPELPELCIKAGTSEKGACSKCGAPWVRITEKTPIQNNREPIIDEANRKELHGPTYSRHKTSIPGGQSLVGYETKQIGWQPSCTCGPQDITPCLVLDPFAGSGTTLMVAARLGRDYVGIELNPEYVELVEERIRPAEEYKAQHFLYELMHELPQE